jgi:GrpB-like predicted nucleotidyltransferase (UPF0157 family)
MGLMRNIVVVEYRSEWPDAYAREAGVLGGALRAVLVASHHVGSTSVPGLASKPIIDIMLVVRSLDEMDACNDAMGAVGYLAKGELGIAGRRFFSKGADADRSHHVHAYEAEHPEVAAHLDFRDYLRARPERALEYAELKAKLAVRYRNDIEAYVAGKEPLILEILADARRWRDGGFL